MLPSIRAVNILISFRLAESIKFSHSVLWKLKGVLTKLCSYSINICITELKGGYDGNSLLYEVQEKGRNKKPPTRYAQEPQTSDQRCLP